MADVDVIVIVIIFSFQVAERDGGSRDSNGGRAYAKGSPVTALPALSIDDFKVRRENVFVCGAGSQWRLCN